MEPTSPRRITSTGGQPDGIPVPGPYWRNGAGPAEYLHHSDRPDLNFLGLSGSHWVISTERVTWFQSKCYSSYFSCYVENAQEGTEGEWGDSPGIVSVQVSWDRKRGWNRMLMMGNMLPQGLLIWEPGFAWQWQIWALCVASRCSPTLRGLKLLQEAGRNHIFVNTQGER